MALGAVMLGFVLSMIFGHAPIIFPALTGRTIAYNAYFYVCLIVREIGDLTLWMQGWMWGGLLNIAAVLIFIVTILNAGLLRKNTELAE